MMDVEKTHILLVEDDEIDRIAIKRLFQQEDLPYILAVAATVGEAIEELRQDEPDLVLIDHQLPDGSGLEVQKAFGEIPCIFITGAKDLSIAVQAMKAGAYDYLVKDTQREYLQLLPSIIQACLDRKELAAHINVQAQIINSLGEIVLLKDENGLVLFANEAVKHVLGYMPEEVLGTAWYDLLAIPNPAQRRTPIKPRIGRNQTPQYYDIELRCRDGQKIWMAWTEIFRENEGLICVGRDITPRKRMDQELQRAHDMLEQRVRARTLDLEVANKQLKALYEQFKKESDERKQLSKQLIDLLEADRFAVATDLHDHIGQNLTTLKLDLERLVNSKTADAVSSTELLDRAKLKVDLVMKEVKNLARGLRPVALDVLGLVPSLRSLFTEIQESSGIEIDFYYTEIPERLDHNKKLGIYRIAQEAITNILKHAKAHEVQVNLIAKEDIISISVEDDGVGFDYTEFRSGPHANESLGLVLMRERAIQLNGEFSLESRTGYGTQVLIEIPV